MTRLRELRVERVQLRFTEPVRYGAMTTSIREAGIVRLHTDDDLEGLGEIGSPVVALETLVGVLELAADLRGIDVADGPALDEALARSLPAIPQAHHLRAAVETAALDVCGRACGSPVRDLLGGGSDRIRVNALLLANPRGGEPRAIGAVAASLVAAGFRCLKLKREVGSPGLEAALRAIRESVGPSVALRLDLNGDLTEHGAIEWLRTLAWADLEYAEQPIPASLGPQALARVRRAVPMPIAADEAVTDPDAAAELLLTDACDVLVVKPARVGGPRQAHRIVRAATEAGVGVTISTLYETGIGLAAAAQVAATVPGDGAHGLGTGAFLEDDLVGGAMVVRDGTLALPDGPGLGVTLDEAALERHRTPWLRV